MRVVTVLHNAVRVKLKPGDSLLLVIDDDIATPEVGDAVARISDIDLEIVVKRSEDKTLHPSELTIGTVLSSRTGASFDTNVRAPQPRPTAQALRL